MTSYSLSWPSTDCTKFDPLVVKCPFGFLFFEPTLRASRPLGSKSYMTHCMTAWTMSLGTFSSCSCRIFFAWPGIPEDSQVCPSLLQRPAAHLQLLRPCSLRKQPSFFAPGPSGFRTFSRNTTRAGSEEGRLFLQANVLVTLKDTKMAKPAIE